MQVFKANGKLLISGEYAVIDGALALAVPVKKGQILKVDFSDAKADSPKLFWKAFLDSGELWFQAEFHLNPLKLIDYTGEIPAKKLLDLFKIIAELQPAFFQNQTQSIHCSTFLEFPKEWGLGSSSTLISLLSQWTGADAFSLNQKSFNTSGYDVACASADSPILYKNTAAGREIIPVKFQPDFLDCLHLVYLNEKQDTQNSVQKNYRSLPKDFQWIQGISEITREILKAKTLDEFEALINQHEMLIAGKLNLPRVKDSYFPDFTGSVKSLGAWGGDFVLITERKGFETYFNSMGYSTIFPFRDLLIQ